MKNRCEEFQASVPANSEVALLLHCIDSRETLGSVVISAETFASIEQRARECGLTLDALLKSFAGGLADGSAPVGHKKSFFQVNLSAGEQKEMRECCRELDVEFRTIIRNAVIAAKLELRERVEIKKRTGWTWSRQFSVLDKGSMSN